METTVSSINLLEKYVCYFCKVKSRLVSDTRWKIFDKKYQRENKEPDLTSLPTYHQVFLIHALRSNYVAYT